MIVDFSLEICGPIKKRDFKSGNTSQAQDQANNAFGNLGCGHAVRLWVSKDSQAQLIKLFEVLPRQKRLACRQAVLEGIPATDGVSFERAGPGLLRALRR